MADARNLIDDVRRAREGVLQAVAGLSPAQGGYRASPHAWSIAHNVEHLFLAEVSGITKIWAARRAGRCRGGVVLRGSRVPRALTV